jgi:hypothetical protein
MWRGCRRAAAGRRRASLRVSGAETAKGCCGCVTALYGAGEQAGTVALLAAALVCSRRGAAIRRQCGSRRA